MNFQVMRNGLLKYALFYSITE